MADDVLPCVIAKVARRPKLLAELRQLPDEGPVPGALLDVGAECMLEIHAAPAFVDSVAQSASRPLTDAQSTCLTDGYVGLDQEVRDAAVADALSPGTKAEAKAKKVRAMIRSCGVEL